jgi:hypothetical protein
MALAPPPKEEVCAAALSRNLHAGSLTTPVSAQKLASDEGLPAAAAPLSAVARLTCKQPLRQPPRPGSPRCRSPVRAAAAIRAIAPARAKGAPAVNPHSLTSEFFATYFAAFPECVQAGARNPDRRADGARLRAGSQPLTL